MHQRQLYKQHEEQQAAEQRRKEGMQGLQVRASRVQRARALLGCLELQICRR
jgi:hypothetical protein